MPNTTITTPTLALATPDSGTLGDGITNNGVVNVGQLLSNSNYSSGYWQYSTDGGTNWSDKKSLSATSFTLSDGAYAADIILVRQSDGQNISLTAKLATAITIDTTKPSLSESVSIINTTTGAYTFSFGSSEPLLGFEISDVVVAGSAALKSSSWIVKTTDNKSFALEVTPLANSSLSATAADLTVSVSANSATDAAGNSLTAGTSLSVSVLIGSTNAQTLNGTANPDSIYGGGGQDTISAGAGNDGILTTSGNDSIDGGAGNDEIYAGDGNNVVLGGDGNDSIVSGAGNDLLNGGANNDTLTAGAGNDTLIGSAGADLINLGTGTDTVKLLLNTDSTVSESDTLSGFTAGDKIEIPISNAYLGENTLQRSSTSPVVLSNWRSVTGSTAGTTQIFVDVRANSDLFTGITGTESVIALTFDAVSVVDLAQTANSNIFNLPFYQLENDGKALFVLAKDGAVSKITNGTLLTTLSFTIPSNNVFKISMTDLTLAAGSDYVSSPVLPLQLSAAGTTVTSTIESQKYTVVDDGSALTTVGDNEIHFANNSVTGLVDIRYDRNASAGIIAPSDIMRIEGVTGIDLSKTDFVFSSVLAYANHSAVATGVSISTSEDSAYSATLSATDADNDALVFSKVANPSHGTVTINATTGAFTYTPAKDFYGTDSFTFKVNDGTVDSAAATVSVSVAAVNDAPQATMASASTDEDNTKSGMLAGTDIEGNTLTFAKVADPSHGTATVNATTGAYTYTPAKDFNGTDSFTFKVNDGKVDSPAATVSITVTAVNDAPQATAATISTEEDTVKTGALTGTDIDGNTLSFAKVADPSHGTVTINATTGVYTYTPAKDFNGTDSFTFKVNDAGAVPSFGFSNWKVSDVAGGTAKKINLDIVATQSIFANIKDQGSLIYIQLTAPNISKIAQIGNEKYFSDYATPLYQDGKLELLFMSDGPVVEIPKGETLTTLSFEVSSLDESFSLTASDAAFAAGTTYTFFPVPPAALDYKGQSLDSSIGIIKISVQALNDLPIARPLSISIDEDTAKSDSLTGTDVDGNALTFAKVTDPGHGTVTINPTTGAYTYIPNNDFNGTDSFTFKVNDGAVDSEIATVSIAVNAINDRPMSSATLQSLSAKEGSNFAFKLPEGLFTDTDAGDSLTLTAIGLPTGLSLQTTNGESWLKGTPAQASAGSYAVTLKALDSGGLSAESKFTFSVAPDGVGVNVKPIMWGSNAVFNQLNVDMLPVGNLSNELYSLNIAVNKKLGTFEAKLSSNADQAVGSFQFNLNAAADIVGNLQITKNSALSNWTILETGAIGLQKYVAYTNSGLAADYLAKGQTILTLNGKLPSNLVAETLLGLSGMELGSVTKSNPLEWKSLEANTFSTDSSGYVFSELGNNGYEIFASEASAVQSSNAFSANDALLALRLALGLTQTERAVSPYELIAADINRDGRVSVFDAYAIAQKALGVAEAPPTDFVFLDANADLSGINRRSVNYSEGVSFAGHADGDYDVALVGVLLGDVNHSFVAV